MTEADMGVMPLHAKDRHGPTHPRGRERRGTKPASSRVPDPDPHSCETIKACCFRPPHWGALSRR